jgi:hypothetical protein
LNWIKIQLKINEVQIDAKCIENLLVISTICDYDIEKKLGPKHINI